MTKWEEAPCANRDPDLFVLDGATADSVRKAVRVCDRCPLRESDCLRVSLDRRPIGVFQAGFAWIPKFKNSNNGRPVSGEQYIALKHLDGVEALPVPA